MDWADGGGPEEKERTVAEFSGSSGNVLRFLLLVKRIVGGSDFLGEGEQSGVVTSGYSIRLLARIITLPFSVR